jgi:hypothetical protein
MPDRSLPHLKNTIPSIHEDYTSPNSGRQSYHLRDDVRRLAHGGHLHGQLINVDRYRQRLKTRRREEELDDTIGLVLEFESYPEFDLAFERLDLAGSNIELLSVKQDEEGKTVATVYVPDDKIQIFLSKIDRYLTTETPGGKPRERNLVESVANIRSATLKSFWTDTEDLFPEDGEAIWWEVWLTTFFASFDVVVSRFQRCAEVTEIELQEEVLKLRDRAVLLAYGTEEQLSKSAELLGFMAEVRKAKATTEEITGLPPFQQGEWIDDFLDRVQPAPADAPAVCILDTGVNSGHPLLQPHIPANGMHAYDSAWGVQDHSRGPFAGHGTEMSGLCLFGGLFPHFVGNAAVQLSHHLESVKILPDVGANDPKLYGEIIRESIARVEVVVPDRGRVFSMAVTADGRDNGYPSSWSTAVDRIAYGEDGSDSKLIFISAGNVLPEDWKDYTNCNTLSSVKDPAQAWNAVTVGAYTDMITIPNIYPEYTPLARSGELSPTSCTSAKWNWSDTPVKPEIVMEGGNIAYDGDQLASKLDSLSLLTTGHDLVNAPLVPTGETSAAVSQVSRMGAMIYAEYPHYRPETIRALLIHSAEWTPAMRAQFPGENKEAKESLLRHCGYGVPSLENAMHSASNSLNLVIEDTIQPYKQGNSFHELKLHSLPWPQEALYDIATTPITMKVTLSYFIDALAGRRGFQGKFSYPSHRLGFRLKRVDESVDAFRARINRVVSDSGIERGDGTEHGWFLGPQLQTRGTINSDTWIGTAADLAESGVIAVYPKVGWWRSLVKQRCWDNVAHYSLVVSISTPSENVDLYALVSEKIRVMTPVKIKLPIGT